MQKDTQKVEVGTETNLKKDKFISQVLDELGIGREDSNIAKTLSNMAEKIAELCYEVKQLKGNN